MEWRRQHLPAPHPCVHSPHPPFSLYVLTLLCCAPARQCSLQSSLGPSHLLFLWPSHILRTSCCPQLSLLMQLALTQPCVSYREEPPCHMGSHCPGWGCRCVPALFCSLAYARFVVFLHCVCKSFPTQFQGEGFAPSNTGRKECLHHSNLHKRQC